MQSGTDPMEGESELDEESELRDNSSAFQPKPHPSLEEYALEWSRVKELHSRAVPGEFSRDNLVPCPMPDLWQDCPHVPFNKLESNEAQARLSVCRPHSCLEPAHCPDGVPRYAHNTGDCIFSA